MNVLGAIGLTFIIVRGGIMKWFRDIMTRIYLGELVTCTLCTGFWCGMLIECLHGSDFLTIFEVGSATSICAYVIGEITNFLKRQ